MARSQAERSTAKAAPRRRAAIATAVVSSVAPSSLTPLEIQREIRDLVAAGAPVRPAGLAAANHTPLADFCRLVLNETAAEIQRQSLEAQARVARLEEDLRFERLYVLQLEKRISTWLGLVGATFRKAAGLKTRAPARIAGQTPR